MKNILVAISLLFSSQINAQTGVYFNAENLRSDTIDVLNYEIHLNVTDFTNKTLSGFTTVKFTPLMNNVATLNLDLLHYNVDSITFNGANLNYTYNDTLLSIDLGGTFSPANTLEVSVYYHGTTQLDPSGWGGFYYGNNYAFNLGVGFQANPHNVGRYWFPCFDNFKERSTYDFFITTKNTHYGTSCGALISSVSGANNTTIWHWRLEETIPTYLAMIAVNAYEVVSSSYAGLNGTIPIQLYAKASDTANLKASFIHLEKAMDAFEKYYGPYQFNKIGYTVVNFSSGAMEHASNITYPNNTVDGTVNSETLMAHELAHQWWGNYATTLTPQDMWLNEGMASFSANLFLEETYNWPTAQQEWKKILLNILRKAHIDEGGYLAISGVPHSLTYGDHVYRKGALVAQNLRQFMGDTNFKNTMTGFLHQHAFNSMTSIQLRDYIQNQLNIDAEGFFDNWVFNGGFPDYAIDSIYITPTTGNYQVYVRFKQKQNHAPAPFTSLPIEIDFYNNQFQKITETAQLGPGFTEINFNLPFEPTFLNLNPNNKLMYSCTDDTYLIKQTGPINYTNALMNINVVNISDSALLKIEHHWASPDQIKMVDTKPYRLSNYRYWKVDGIIPSDFEAEASFLYDGRAAGGYLDSFLVNITEDSLVLLYRATPQDDWEEYPYYTKNTLGGSSNKFGRMEISKLQKGEYTLANIDHTALGVIDQNNNQKIKTTIYPNPSEGHIYFSWNQNVVMKNIQIFDLTGKLVHTINAQNKKQVRLESNHLQSGQYVATFNYKNGTKSSQFSVL